MAVITRSVPRTGQPIGPVAVDPALGWQAAWVGGRDVLSKGAWLPGAVPSLLQQGRAAQVTLPSTLTFIPLNVPVGASWSLLMAVNPAQLAPGYAYFLGMTGTTNSVAISSKHKDFANRTIWYDGANVLDSGILLIQGVEAVLGLTCDGATGRYSWFCNGAAHATTLGKKTGTGVWNFRNIAGEPSAHSFSLFAIANRAIPAEKMRQLTANPWSAFEPERRRAYFTAPSAPLSSFWANVGGTPTRSLGLRAWNGSAVVTPVARIWTGSAWESVQ